MRADRGHALLPIMIVFGVALMVTPFASLPGVLSPPPSAQSHAAVAASTPESAPSPPVPSPLVPSTAAPSVAKAASAFFTENVGQLSRDDIRYAGNLQGLDIAFAPSTVLISLTDRPAAPAPGPALMGAKTARPAERGVLVEVTFPGSATVPPVARGESAHRANYFFGSDPSAWVHGARSFTEVVYPSLWPGIDLVYRATPEGAKYEFRLAPGADTSTIRIAYGGIEAIDVAASGELVVRTAAGDLSDSVPASLQSSGAPVECRFAAVEASTVGFACLGRDVSSSLTIDPLVSSTYLGGSDFDQANGVAADANGNTIVTGQLYSTNFPITVGAYDTTKNTDYDIFVSMLSADGSALLYSTFIGGNSYDYANGVAVDSFGNAYVTGFTYSSDYPTTVGAYNRSNRGVYDTFLTKLNSSGATLDYSSMLGGNSYDYGQAVSVDASGIATVGGYTSSSNFPITNGAFDNTENGGQDVFVTRFNKNGTGLVASTFVGGNSDEYGFGLAVDSQGNSFMTGYTYSYNFPTTPGANSRTQSGNWDVFAFKINANLTNLTYGTFIGGNNYEQGTAIAVDAAGAAFVTGFTYSNNFPTTGSAYESQYTGSYDAFVLKLDNFGAIVYSTYLGGTQDDQSNGIAIDSSGLVLIAGQTYSTDFPMAGPPLNGTLAGSYDAFAAKFNATLSTLIYSTFLGGMNDDYAFAIAVDGNGTGHIVGYTYSSDFPVTQTAFQSGNRGYYDAFVTKIDMRLPRLSITTDPPGLTISLDGASFIGPHNRSCSSSLLAYAPSPQVFGLTRYLFDHWSDNAPQLHSLPCNNDATIVAYFTTQHAFTINSTPPGLYISIDDYNLTAPQSYWWDHNSTHTIIALSPQIVGSSRWAFTNWSDGGAANHTVVASAPQNYTAAFFPLEHRMTFNTVPSKRQVIVDGESALSPVQYWWPVGSQHTIEAPSPQAGAPGVRYVFSSWSDFGAANHTVTATAPLTFTALFNDEFLTIIDTEPANLSIMVDGVEVQTPTSYWWANGSIHTLATAPVTETNNDTRYAFDRWNDVAPENRTVRADGAVTMRATFVPSAFRVQLDTLPTGLDLEVDGARLTAPLAFWWDARTDHVIAAVSPQEKAGGRFFFIQWSDRLQRSHTVTAYSPFSVLATFNAEFLATVDSNPTGFQVSVDGTAVTTPWTGWWRSATDHRLTIASPQKVTSDTRFNFDSWSDGGLQDHTANITEPTTFLVSFKADYKVTASSQYGLAGCDQSACWYPESTTATVSVTTPRAGSAGVQYAFARWTGDSTAETPSVAIVMDGPKVISAIWKTQFFLAVASSYGTASGEGWYDEGSTAAFSIAPSDLDQDGTHYRFVGWTGAVTSSTASDSVLMSGAKNIAAQWEADAPPPPDTTQPTTNTGGASSQLPVGMIALVAAAVGAAVVGFLVITRRRRSDDDDVSAAPATPADHGPIVVDAPALRPAPPPAAVRPVKVSKPSTPPAAPAAATVAAPVAAAAPSAPSSPPAAETDPCPDCGEPIEVGWAACPVCGLELEWG